MTGQGPHEQTVPADNASTIHVGDRVAWNWGSSHAEGVVAEEHHQHVTKTIKGKEISRNASDDNPAFFVERDASAKNKTPVLKRGSELHKLTEAEHAPSTQHVDTARQRELRSSDSGAEGAGGGNGNDT